MNRYKENRNFLKADFSVLDNIKTDMQKKMPKPPIQKELGNYIDIIDLPKISEEVVKKSNVYNCIKDRRSIRLYENESMSLEELGFLLWATQGIEEIKGDNKLTLRTAPSGGACHTFETYLLIKNVKSLKQGVYRYLPIEHKLLFMYEMDNYDDKVDKATPKQPFVPNFASKSAVIFAWSTIPYRAEYKFDITAHKKILIDVGHVCQNLYLASEAIKFGTCAIGIYDQELIDNMLQLDGENEFVIYMAAVGKLIQKNK